MSDENSQGSERGAAADEAAVRRPLVLIAEDNFMIADMAEEILVQNGYDVCGIARTVAEGVELGQLHKPDLALLDLRLAEDGLGTEIAARLNSAGRLGILYVTGNMSEAMLSVADGDACLAKPYSSADLLRGLQIVRDIVRSRELSRPFPRGFHVLKPAPAGATA